MGGDVVMKRSTERFLTTHTGSLPRPDDLIQMMYAKENGEAVDPAALAARIRSAVAEVVQKQVALVQVTCSTGRLRSPVKWLGLEPMTARYSPWVTG